MCGVINLRSCVLPVKRVLGKVQHPNLQWKAARHKQIHFLLLLFLGASTCQCLWGSLLSRQLLDLIL